MKAFHYLIIVLVLLLPFSAHSQNKINDIDKTASFCKVWGFLKYFHPAVTSEKFDWDHEFMIKVKSLDSLHSKNDLSLFYIHWIDQLGKLKECKTCTVLPNSASPNFDLAWLTDSALFTSDLITRFKTIAKQEHPAKSYYVQPFPAGHVDLKHEKHYPDSAFPSSSCRLLTLSRYWNIINYFYPYKYKTDQNWNDVLREMIPKFINCNDTLSYHLALMELIAKLNDSHASFNTLLTYNYFGLQRPPFMFKIIDDKIVATGYYNDSLCKLDDIQRGDVFISIDEKNVEEIINEKSKYIGASNRSAMIRRMHAFVFNGQSRLVTVTFERNGVIQQKTIHRYLTEELKYTPKADTRPSLKIIDSTIGYINVATFKKKQVHEMIKKMKGTKAIIFDVRGYPNFRYGEVSKFLNKEKKPFVKFVAPDLSCPGTFKESHTSYCGTNNPDYYKGKVIILCNEFAQSAAEFIIMALQTAPDVTIIGSQTSGADGNVSLITLPGGYESYMSGLGVYYPNGKETQRIGIVPDIEVKPTIAGIRAKKDEVLEKALEVARMQK